MTSVASSERLAERQGAVTHMSIATVVVDFEAAHRLPHLPGLCRSLHGHSWHAEIAMTGPRSRAGTVVDFDDFSSRVCDWVGEQLDHATMLGVGDVLVDALSADETCRLFRFGTDKIDGPESLAGELMWPTPENVAELLAKVAMQSITPSAPMHGVAVHGVRVTEKAGRVATFLP